MSAKNRRLAFLFEKQIGFALIDLNYCFQQKLNTARGL
jgi:hypothetical protein